MGTHTANEPSSGSELAHLLLANEEWLTQRVQHYGRERGFAPRSSAVAEAWRQSITGLTASLVAAIERSNAQPESGVDVGWLPDPATPAGQSEGLLPHMSRLASYLFPMMYGSFEDSYLELIEQSEMSPDAKGFWSGFVRRVFEELESAFCQRWGLGSVDQGRPSFDPSCRGTLGEETTFRAVFENLQVPVLLLDAEGRIRNMNRQALRLIAVSDPSCAAGRLGKIDVEAVSSSTLRGCDPEELFPWLPPKSRLLGSPASVERFECAFSAGGQTRVFEGRVSRLLDGNGWRVGSVLVLNDVSGYKALAERLDHLANTDDLTQVNNRRRFFEVAHQEILRARRYCRDFSLLLIDVDEFKRVNDNYGHAAGDQLLVALAQAMQETLRRTDTLGRVGGEEFAIALPETSEEAARIAAERLRSRIAQTSVPVPIGMLGVTVSVGTATLASGDQELEALLRRADQALYEAKAAGRDRVIQSQLPTLDSAVLGTPSGVVPRSDTAADPFTSFYRR